MISLPASKSDPFRKGVLIVVAAAPGTTTCPVEALKNLVESHPADPNAPLFVREGGHTLTRKQFISRVKCAATAIGLDDSKFPGHSFHRGAATTAGSVEYSDFEIQQLGQWRSDAYHLYIDVP